MDYTKALKKILDEAKPATGMSRDELQARIAEINEMLKKPMGNAERIMLCGDRASLRKALEELPSQSAA